MEKYCGISSYKRKQSAKALKEVGWMTEDSQYYIFKRLPEITPYSSTLFETAIYCLDNLSPFVTKMYVYLWWGFDYFNKKKTKNGFELFDDPYCISLAGLGRILGYSDSKNTNRKILSGLKTLQKVGLINFNENYYYKTLENGQVTHFYRINYVYDKSAVQTELAAWAMKDPDIATEEDYIREEFLKEGTAEIEGEEFSQIKVGEKTEEKVEESSYTVFQIEQPKKRKIRPSRTQRMWDMD